MTDFLKIAKSIAVHFAHICAYGVETVNRLIVNFAEAGLLPARASEQGNVIGLVSVYIIIMS